MPFIPVPNTAQFELIYNWSGQVCENVLHYVKASPWDYDDLELVCGLLRSKWDTAVQPAMPTTLSLTSIKGTDMSSQTGPTITYATGLPLAGLSGSPSLPNNCALVITKRTALRGRSFRGRLYMPGLVEADVTNNNVSGAQVAAFIVMWNNFLVCDMGDDEALLCVVSKFSGGSARATGVATLVANLTSDGVIDSQRNRLPGRGN